MFSRVKLALRQSLIYLLALCQFIIWLLALRQSQVWLFVSSSENTRRFFELIGIEGLLSMFEPAVVPSFAYEGNFRGFVRLTEEVGLEERLLSISTVDGDVFSWTKIVLLFGSGISLASSFMTETDHF